MFNLRIMRKIRIKNFTLILFFLAIVSGIIWGMPFDRPLGSDAHSFNQAALSILDNGIFYKSDFMNFMIERSFYPLFIAGVYKISGHYPVVVRLVQVIIFALLTLLVYKLCQSIFEERLARLAGFMTALCYSIASFTGWLYREVFFCTLIFLLIYCLYQAQIKKKIIWFVVAGIVFGMASLTNSIVQFFIIFIIINFLFLNRKEGLKKIFIKLVWFILAFIIFVSPWVINDYINYGRTPFLSKSGFLLAMKAEKMHDIQGAYVQHLVANTTGDFFAQKLFLDYDRREARLGYDSRLEWEEMIKQGADRKEADAIMRNRGIEDIIKHPIMFLEMSFIDFLKFNTPMVPNVRMQHMFAEPNSHPYLSDFVKGSIILFIRFVYLIFAVFIIYAIVKRIRNWSKMSWIILIIIYFNLIFSNIHAIARYSVPMYPFYIILLAIGILIIWDRMIGVKKDNFKVNNF